MIGPNRQISPQPKLKLYSDNRMRVEEVLREEDSEQSNFEDNSSLGERNATHAKDHQAPTSETSNQIELYDKAEGEID